MITTDGRIFSRETIYKGVKMRSRLEAAWAEQFDALGWQWEYEPVCLAGAGQYLPDFRLTIPHTKTVFAEVKGGWWQDPKTYGVEDDDEGWDVVYQAMFDDCTRMSTLVYEFDPNSIFMVFEQRENGHSLEMWRPGKPSAIASRHPRICVCSDGCSGFVEAAGTVCWDHRQEWTDVVPVESLHAPLGLTSPRRPNPDEVNLLTRAW